VGGFGSGSGKFDYPCGVAADGQGRFCGDSHNNLIQKFDPGAGFSPSGRSGRDGQFANPRSVAVDGQGNLYVADSDNYRIQKFDSDGRYLTQEARQQ
jgi:DNA-binding beta-propeller fold protein YncE